MKNLIYVVFAMILISCGDDQLSDSIVGEWQLLSITISSCPDSANNLPLITADTNGCLTANGTNICQTVTFNADGTATNTTTTDGVVMTQELTYTVNEDNNTITSLDASNNSNTFVVTDNTITLINPFGDCTITSELEKQ